jgi:beta-lactamase class A
MRLVALLCSFFALVVAQPAAAASSPALASLEQQLSWVGLGTGADVGIAALDLGTGEWVMVNGDTPFPMASTMKIAVAANYLAQVEYGRRTLDDRIGGRTARSLLDAMIVRSDNHATDLLIEDLGGPAVLQAWLSQQGLQGIRIDRTIDQLLRSKRDLYDVRDSATPRAMVELLRRLDKGEMLQPWSRAYLTGLMARCITGKNRIRGMLPAGTHVENKTGTLNGLTTDVGFITLPDGRRVAVAFFARGGQDRPRTIATAARTIFYGMAERWRRGVSALSAR